MALVKHFEVQASQYEFLITSPALSNSTKHVCVTIYSTFLMSQQHPDTPYHS